VNGGAADSLDAWRLRSDQRRARRIRSVADARRLAHRRLPLPVENYLEGGAGDERTMAANLAAVGAVQLLPRMGDTTGAPPDQSTTVLGTPVALPFLLSPVGFTRMMHPAGDVAAATAAGAAGTVFTLSSMSGHSMGEVMEAATGPAWFQLYFLGGREGAEQLVARARAHGFAAVVITMDTQMPGDRRRESRYGLSPPLQVDLRTATKMAPFVALRPRWLLDELRDGLNLELAHATGLGPEGSPMSAGEALLRWLGSPPGWDDVVRVKEQFEGPVIVKGVLTADDARRAVDCGASAVVVSNHGGRQLDGAPATFAALGEVVGAVGEQVDVLVDGGVRSGVDVVRALALGAKAAMVGRAWAYGLCAAGLPGVERVIALLMADIDRTMRLVGAASVAAIEPSMARPPTVWPT
jgi:isopentenyl diphosphate isomerase/L-lactate dehydrogenase-like FMN-dependent dehydrogenase